tara:strand:- start:70 stop:201 length:132 start_codon:yes stop_codon:yes gene_type:complete
MEIGCSDSQVAARHSLAFHDLSETQSWKPASIQEAAFPAFSPS